MNATATHIATSVYGTVREVTISAKGLVHTTTGVLLGDLAGMEQAGWDLEAVAA